MINFVGPKIKNLLAAAFYKRVCEILVKEGVEYDKAVVKLIQLFPALEGLNELQQAGASGGITGSCISR